MKLGGEDRESPLIEVSLLEDCYMLLHSHSRIDREKEGEESRVTAMNRRRVDGASLPLSFG